MHKSHKPTEQVACAIGN